MQATGTAGPRWVDQPAHRHWLHRHATHLLDFYSRGTVDPRGGFFDLEAAGRPLPTGWPPATRPTRNLFQTTRMVHIYSLGHLMGYPGAWPIVDHGMDFLWSGHRDTSHGGYFWSNSYSGPYIDAKQAYGHAFVLLAAASARTAGHPDADRLLSDVTQVIEDRFWEEPPGASREEFTADWTPIGTYRGQNCNMHLTEALMAAADATGDAAYLEKAVSIASLLIRDITAANSWRLPEHYHEDWSIDFDYAGDVFRPYGSTVGHWLEWSRLIIQLWETTERRHDWMPDAARNLFQQAVTEGWDEVHGGFYFTVGWDGKPVDKDRYWWPSTEGIGAAHALANLDSDGSYESWYRKIWSWSHQHLIDHEGGSWHHQLDDRLQPTSDPWFGKPDVYHSVQAALIPLLPTDQSLAAALKAGRMRP